MNSYQAVFQRYEKKYLINRRQYRRLLGELNGLITADEYGRHTISNIYFDTENFSLVQTSLAKPAYKEKLRLRAYGVPKADDNVFIEIKKKSCGIVYKRRVEMPFKQAHSFLVLGAHPPQMGQIHHEIEWFLKRYQPSGKAIIAYDRTAYYGNEDNALRITFDENIRWRDNYLDLTKGHFGSPLMPESQVLMEIKISGAMPLWLNHILTQLHIYPTSYSKYGACYANYILPKQMERGGSHCA